MIRPAGDGRAAPLAVATQWRTGGQKQFVLRGAAQRRGNCFRRTVAAMKPEAQPRPRQDSQQHKDALGRTTPHPKGAMATPASPHEGFSGTPPDSTRPFPNDQRECASSHAGGHAERTVWSPQQGRATIREPSFVTTRAMSPQRRGRHAFAQPAAASPGVPTGHCPCDGALARPIRRCRFGGIEERQACAAGIARRAFPRR